MMDGAATPALVVFAKVPTPGAVKTRLSPPLSAEEASELYRAFVGDALEAWSRPDCFELPTRPAVRLYVAPGDGPRPDDFAPAGVSVHTQRGASLGDRMLHASVETFAVGHDRVVVIGTDHPTLPNSFIAQAFAALDEPMTVVLGPSDDGGYYLVGMNDFVPSLFEGLSYSHPDVLEEALARALEAGLQPVLLPAWYDVDTPAALERLRDDYRAGVAVGRRTAGVLEALQSA